MSKFKPTPPTHYCAVCGDPLWRDTWKYAACKPCGKKCPHGNKPADCDVCYADSDRAFEVAHGR